MSILCFHIDQIPDLSLNKYQTLASSGVDGVLERHSNFLRQWHGICIESETSFHLLYVFVPSETLGKRLKLYLCLQGEAERIKLIEPLLKRSPLSVFYNFQHTDLSHVNFKAGATLLKMGRLAEIYNPLTGQSNSVHYVPKWTMNEQARLYDLFETLETVGMSYSINKPCAFRIDLYPVSLAQETRSQFSPVLKTLRGENDIRILNETNSLHSNSYVKDICKEYENWITAIETNPHFRINMYAFAETAFQAKIILNAVGAESIKQGDFSLALIKADENGLYNSNSRMEIHAEDYCVYPKQACLASWPTTYCLNEVEPFFRLPVLFEGETIEIPKETAASYFGDGICLGKDVHNYPVYFPIESLPRHAFFTGMPGSGKTNTMLYLITQLHKAKIPFLVLEPSKKEYRALMGDPSMHDTYLFSPHLQSRFPLHMNPLEFPRGVRLSEHINALLEVFEGSFVLEGPTYKFLSSSIQKAYSDLGWDIEDIYDENCELTFPRLQDVVDNLETEIEKSSYDSELKGNVRAFLQVRLGGLMERDAGELFNVSSSTLNPDEWVSSSALVELEVLGEQTKNFFVLLVSHYIFETLRANPKGGEKTNGELMPVRHVIFIEEAHNIIAETSTQSGSDSVNPKISATAYIIKMLAEVRALRECIIIADQLPTTLASEVTKNTNLKIVHRLTSQDDRQQIGASISASSLQLEQMASLACGKAFIFHEQIQKPFLLQIEKFNQPLMNFDYTDDEELYMMICDYDTTRRSVKHSYNNWTQKYLVPTSDKVFALLNDYESSDKFNVVELCCFKNERLLLMKECEQLEKKRLRLERLWGVDKGISKRKMEEEDKLFQFIKEMRETLASLDVV